MSTIIAIGRCPCCGVTARLQQEFCNKCIAAFGDRMATLIVRARTDKDFAKACLQSMSPAARKSFVKVLDKTNKEVSG